MYWGCKKEDLLILVGSMLMALFDIKAAKFNHSGVFFILQEMTG